nr:substrate-binding domain-containing protein [Granulicella aggregans]
MVLLRAQSLSGAGLLAFASLLCVLGCRSNEPASIAVVPRTSGTILWEPENVGAQAAAAELGERIYWNASTREDDINGQIALVDRIRLGSHRGLVLAPDHSLALITPVRRALANGLPIVIVGSPLPIPAGDNLTYVLNDEQEGGRLAAVRVAELVHGQGQIALIGVNPDIAGVVLRANSLELNLTALYPKVHIVVRRMGTFNFEHEQEGAEEVLKENPDLDVIVALTSTSTRGAISSIESEHPSRLVRVIGFDPDTIAFDNASLDSVIVQNTRKMGDQAVRLIHARLGGQRFAASVMLQPILVTRQNFRDPVLREMLYTRWRPGAADLKRSEAP